MLKNNIYIGSIKDSDNVWHPVISSPDEDYCHRYCQRLSGDELDPELVSDQFYTTIYTVELLPFVLPEDQNAGEGWTDLETGEWVETDEDEIFQEEYI